MIILDWMTIRRRREERRVTLIGILGTKITENGKYRRLALRRQTIGLLATNGILWNGETILEGDIFVLMKSYRGKCTRLLLELGLTKEERDQQEDNSLAWDQLQLAPETKGAEDVVESWDEENFRLMFTCEKLLHHLQRPAQARISRNGHPWDGETIRANDQFGLCVGRPENHEEWRRLEPSNHQGRRQIQNNSSNRPADDHASLVQNVWHQSLGGSEIPRASEKTGGILQRPSLRTSTEKTATHDQ
jgi:hypothetical protein